MRGADDPGDEAVPDGATLVALLRDVANEVASQGTQDDDAARRLAIALRTFLGERAFDPSAPGETTYARLARAAIEQDPDVPIHIVGHPLLAGQSSVFPHLDIEVEGLTVSAGLQFGAAFEGPPGLAHGGFVSAAFDVVVSLAAAQVSPWSMTRRLQIRFLRPTYLHDRLTFAATAVEGDHRSIDVHATLRDSAGKTTAKATAEFVRFEPERFTDRRGFGAAPPGQAG